MKEITVVNTTAPAEILTVHILLYITETLIDNLRCGNRKLVMRMEGHKFNFRKAKWRRFAEQQDNILR